MRKKKYDKERRSFLMKIVQLVMTGSAGILVSLRSAGAMGEQPIVEGMHRIEGEVRINNVLVKRGAPVKPDDTISTGARSHAVFVVGEDAFLLRENSRVELSGKSDSTAGPEGKDGIKTLRMAAGKLLSVFGHGAKTFITTTAICGARGTGMYVEAETDRTYVCTCYGEVDLEARASSAARETVKTNHHESPRYIYGRGAERLIEKAPMQNHTDKELIMLESLVKRRPPFMQTPYGKYHDPYQ